MNRKSCLACVTLAALCCLGAVPAITAQDGRAQAEVASRNVKFDVLPRTARLYKEARDATNLEGARKLIGQPASFIGTVTEVAAPEGNAWVALHFAKDPKTAVRVVVRQENFFRFPKLEDLKGKGVVFTARVVAGEGRPEVVLIRPGQLKVVE